MVSIINYSFAEGKWGDTVENADQITPLLLVIKINAYLYKNMYVTIIHKMYLHYKKTTKLLLKNIPTVS